jgi:hypothetical protein
VTNVMTFGFLKRWEVFFYHLLNKDSAPWLAVVLLLNVIWAAVWWRLKNNGHLDQGSLRPSQDSNREPTEYEPDTSSLQLTVRFTISRSTVFAHESF